MMRMLLSLRILIGILLSSAVILSFASPSWRTPWNCQEDQGCWVCQTMGNQICGPDGEPLGTKLQRAAGPYSEVIYCGYEVVECVATARPAYLVEAR